MPSSSGLATNRPDAIDEVDGRGGGARPFWTLKMTRRLLLMTAARPAPLCETQQPPQHIDDRECEHSRADACESACTHACMRQHKHQHSHIPLYTHTHTNCCSKIAICSPVAASPCPVLTFVTPCRCPWSDVACGAVDGPALIAHGKQPNRLGAEIRLHTPTPTPTRTLSLTQSLAGTRTLNHTSALLEVRTLRKK